ncbi:hypothetical protein [Singulisphaera sp. PoT]|uniref:hypothetical protein n=1 Tax=Singulisphaera sp. PoT TaxID=3411797 RepID=UPI003BF4E45E
MLERAKLECISCAVLWLGLGSLAAPARAERMSYLDNGVIRIGVDLDIGGSITFLAVANDKDRPGENLINSHDLGRQVQQSYYAGPQPFGQAHPGWKNWPWNPIGSGDVYGNSSKVKEFTNDGKTLHITTIPMQWALKNVPGECTFETTITLEGPAARVHCRLNNHRPDKTAYPASNQELPAVYTIGKLYRLFTYDGTEPFTNAPLRLVKNDGPPWAFWKATENWAALVDDKDHGVGVVNPGVYAFMGGFHDKPGKGGPKDNPTGYIAPSRFEILDHDIVYDYHYDLVVGPLEAIRAYAVAHRVQDPRPDYQFKADRQHWTYINASDAGFPPKGELKVKLDKNDPQMIGPEQWWKAESAPKLFIKAAYQGTGQDRAEVFWSVAGQEGFSGERSLSFPIKADGAYHTYEVDLSSSPHYRGTITGLRFDPASAGAAGGEVRIESISWKPSEPAK